MPPEFAKRAPPPHGTFPNWGARAAPEALRPCFGGDYTVTKAHGGSPQFAQSAPFALFLADPFLTKGSPFHDVSILAHAARPMILLIDNYDSFTFNLVHYLGELGADVVVRRNDSLDVAEALALGAEAIVVSPGPRDPAHAGICLPLVRAAAGARLPLLGVCLGHQTIGEAFGGRIVRCHEIVHGKVGLMHHTERGVFKGLPSPLKATRYHSLVVERDSLPQTLEITATLEDGTIMGLSHKTLPIHGVQFHPESIASEHGHQVLQNFLDLAKVPA